MLYGGGGVLCLLETVEHLVGEELAEVVHLVPQDGGQGQEVGVLGLLLLAQIILVCAAELA